jgi:AcrR family transcriptional regulator
VTSAPPNRRDQILATAAELFAARGFHGVSVADLGAACGVSGPAIYKHFASKDAVLAEMLVSISLELLAVGRTRVAAAPDAAAALVSLVDWHADFALRHRPLIVVQDRDWQSLPSEARERVRSLQREYVDLWAGQLRLVHDDLDLPRARAMAHATFGLINSTPHSGLLPDPPMHGLLRAMALGALGIGDPARKRGAVPGAAPGAAVVPG